jgi:hypothetical protein
MDLVAAELSEDDLRSLRMALRYLLAAWLLGALVGVL